METCGHLKKWGPRLASFAQLKKSVGIKQNSLNQRRFCLKRGGRNAKREESIGGTGFPGKDR